MAIDATYHDYEFDLVGHRFQDKSVLKFQRVGCETDDLFLIAFEGESELLLYDMKREGTL